MKKLLVRNVVVFLIVTCVSLMGMLEVSNAAEGIAISKPEDLEKLRSSTADSYFYLTNDINMQGYGNWKSVADFQGTLDGSGYSIINYKSDVGGLIDSIKYEGKATICNLGMEKVSLTGKYRIGAILNDPNCATVNITNCYVTGSIVLGGDGNINYDTGVGGIVGCGYGSTMVISNCFNSATISGETNVGGICGGLDKNDKIVNCFNLGQVKILNNKIYSIGGLVGCSEGSIINSISMGKVDSFKSKDDNNNKYVARLVGRLYSTAYISGLYTTSIDNEYEVLANYDSTYASRFDNELGILTRNEPDYIIRGFDFSTIWNISTGINDGYPYLRALSQRYSLSKPDVNVKSGKYSDTIEVSLTHSVEGTTLYYTIDGSNPSTYGNSFVYTSPLKISSTTTLKVLAVNSLFTNSKIAKYVYNFELPKVTSNLPTNGKYTGKIKIKLFCEDTDATIYYTTDGSTPTSSSRKYTTAISISRKTTIKSIAIKGGSKSKVSTFTYRY